MEEFVFSKTVALQLATLLKNDLLHNYFSRPQVPINCFAEDLTEFVSTIIDVLLYSVGLEPQKQATKGLRNYETLVNFA